MELLKRQIENSLQPILQKFASEFDMVIMDAILTPSQKPTPMKSLVVSQVQNSFPRLEITTSLNVIYDHWKVTISKKEFGKLANEIVQSLLAKCGKATLPPCA